jgi:hypothetical protein
MTAVLLRDFNPIYAGSRDCRMSNLFCYPFGSDAVADVLARTLRHKPVVSRCSKMNRRRTIILFDHLVGAGEQRRRNFGAERRGGIRLISVSTCGPNYSLALTKFISFNSSAVD